VGSNTCSDGHADPRSIDASMDVARDRSVQVRNKFEHVLGADADCSYAMSLREIDQMRVDGKFVDANGEKAEGQYVGATHMSRPVKD
jgi:hypothetical protein